MSVIARLFHKKRNEKTAKKKKKVSNNLPWEPTEGPVTRVCHVNELHFRISSLRFIITKMCDSGLGWGIRLSHELRDSLMDVGSLRTGHEFSSTLSA